MISGTLLMIIAIIYLHGESNTPNFDHKYLPPQNTLTSAIFVISTGQEKVSTSITSNLHLHIYPTPVFVEVQLNRLLQIVQI